jgi:hypothetical protein
LKKMNIEGGEVEDELVMSDWLTTTGTSEVRAHWEAMRAEQKFFLWTEEGEVPLGEVDVESYTESQAWEIMRERHPELRDHNQYEMHEGRERPGWRDLPTRKVTLVPAIWMPEIERGNEELLFGLADRVKPMRKAEILFNATWRPYNASGHLKGEGQCEAPREITVGPLAANFIVPRMTESLDVRLAFSWMSNGSEAQVPPKNMSSGYVFQVKGTLLREKPELGLAKLAIRDDRFQLRIRRNLRVGDLRSPLDLRGGVSFNWDGPGVPFHLDGDEGEKE